LKHYATDIAWLSDLFTAKLHDQTWVRLTPGKKYKANVGKIKNI